MKAKLVWLRGRINSPQQYAAVEFEYDQGGGYRRIWRMPCATYDSDPQRAMREAQAIVDAINAAAQLH